MCYCKHTHTQYTHTHHTHNYTDLLIFLFYSNTKVITYIPPWEKIASQINDIQITCQPSWENDKIRYILILKKKF